MIKGFATFGNKRGSRRGGAIWLAILLNLALMPCTMALEVSESGHDCCPPSIELQPSDCCLIDDVNVNARTSTDVPDDAPILLSVLIFAQHIVDYHPDDEAPPPDPCCSPPAIHVANCVFLK